MEIEIWEDIPSYEGIYQASNLGNIRSLDRYVNSRGNGEMLIRGRAMKSRLDVRCYETIRPSVRGKKLYLKVHRLVAQTFIPNPKNKPQINHINGIKKDNRIENLEWVTCKENIIHGFKTGLLSRKHLEKPIRISKDNISLEFGSVRDAAKYLGCVRHALVMVANENYNDKTIYGWKAEYIQKER